MTATASSGAAVHDTGQVLVTDAAPEFARLSAYQDQPLAVVTDASASTDAWKITDYIVDYGDGTAPVDSRSANSSHSYLHSGVYTVALTIKDSTGATAHTTQR